MCSSMDVMSVHFRNRLVVLSDLIMVTGIIDMTSEELQHKLCQFAT